jgi:hypothetical protein
MPREDYRICKRCNRPASEVGALSHTRLCVGCGDERRDANNLGLHYKHGPAFAHWRRSMAACVGGVLLDDVRRSA